jgi:cell division septation protein DedD
MKGRAGHDSRQQICEELKELMALQLGAAESRQGWPSRVFRGNRFMLVFAALAAVVWGSAFFVQPPDRSPRIEHVRVVEAAEEPPSPVIPLDVNQSPADHPAKKAEEYVVRVGSFRDPSNAERVAELLRTRSMNIKTEVLGSGLHVVSVGPLAGRATAEQVARSINIATGLTPDIFPSGW